MPPTERPNEARNDHNNARPNGQTADRPNEQTRSTTKVTVKQAAKLLGLSAEAVRMRLKRGTLAQVKEDNTVYVLLPASRPASRSFADQTDQPNDLNLKLTSDRPNKQTEDESKPLVDALRSEVDFLREELRRREEDYREESRRKDSIIMALTQRVPELEGASQGSQPDERGSPESAGEDAASGEGRVKAAERIELRRTREELEAERSKGFWQRLFGR